MISFRGVISSRIDLLQNEIKQRLCSKVT